MRIGWIERDSDQRKQQVNGVNRVEKIWREKIGAKIGGIRREEQEREQEKA